jgi:hypothetical protein
MWHILVDAAEFSRVAAPMSLSSRTICQF